MAATRRLPLTHGEGDGFTLLRKKTPLQLQTLANLYSVDKHPTESRLEDYALALGLSYKQVSGWFVERRKNENRGGALDKRKNKAVDCSDTELEEHESAMLGKRPVSRKYGPFLAEEFGCLSSLSNQHWHEPEAASDDERRMCSTKRVAGPSTSDSHQSEHGTSLNKHGKGKGLMTAWHVMNYQNDSQASKRRKLLPSKNNLPAKRHGIGKGLMTVWQATCPGMEGYPSGVNEGGTGVLRAPSSRQNKPSAQNKRPHKKKALASSKNQRRLGGKVQDKKKPSSRRRKVGNSERQKQNQNQNKPYRVHCKLSLQTGALEDHFSSSAMLMDDEELELRELQAGPNPLTCSAHFSTGVRHGCPLCKGLLAKFPPNFVRMKHPFCNQPRTSSLEHVKKFFKVFQFLYKYAVIVDACPFTVDEFLQAFNDKDSCLIGELHICLLKRLLSDISKELFDDNLPHTSKNFMFLSLLQSVQGRKGIVKFWVESLNALTWTEVSRQVLLAAGYGSSGCIPRKEAPDKNMDPMARYGLCPGTLKGELFSLIFQEGNQGIKISYLAESSRIADLSLAHAKDELEELISSTLASDITLFEKISCSTYRLRLKSISNEDEDSHSDLNDSETIDGSPKGCGISRSNDSSNCDSRSMDTFISKNSGPSNSDNHISSPGTEIDESHSGEVWMLGLMEGEYSDLSIEEKLNIMVALVDLLSAGSSIRMEDMETVMAECAPKIYQHGSGAKLKRTTQHSSIFPERDGACQSQGIYSIAETQPMDSAHLLLGKDIVSNKEFHSMQSTFLGSDRRFNRYWLFLGPCHASDPGHRRIYFESSEDGHFEVIDTKEALCDLVGVLDSRGRREAVLLESLKKRAAILCDEMSAGESIRASDSLPTQSDQSELDRVNCESSSPVSDVDNHSCINGTVLTSLVSSHGLVSKFGKDVEEEKLKWSRSQAYDMWIWNTFYPNLHSVKHKKHTYLDTLTRCMTCHDLYWRDEKHCRFCHMTFELDFDLEEKYAIHAATCQVNEDSNMSPKHKVLPSQLQALKAAVHAIELAMPENSLIGAWTKSAHKLWIKRLRRTSSLQELLLALANFVDAINKDWLSQCIADDICTSTLEDVVTCFRNMPQTLSALALWLVKLDALVASQILRTGSGCC